MVWSLGAGPWEGQLGVLYCLWVPLGQGDPIEEPSSLERVVWGYSGITSSCDRKGIPLAGPLNCARSSRTRASEVLRRKKL